MKKVFKFLLLIGSIVVIAVVFGIVSGQNVSSRAIAEDLYNGHFIEVDYFDDLPGSTYQGSYLTPGTVAYVRNNSYVGIGSARGLDIDGIGGSSTLTYADLPQVTPYAGSSYTYYYLGYGASNSSSVQQSQYSSTVNNYILYRFTDGGYIRASGSWYVSRSTSSTTYYTFIFNTLRYYDADGNSLVLCQIDPSGSVGINTAAILMLDEPISFTGTMTSGWGFNSTLISSIIRCSVGDTSGYYIRTSSNGWVRSDFDPNTYNSLEYDRGYYDGLASALDSFDVSSLFYDYSDLILAPSGYFLNVPDCALTWSSDNHLVNSSTGDDLYSMFQGHPELTVSDPVDYLSYIDPLYASLGRSFAVCYDDQQTDPIPFTLSCYRVICEINGEIYDFELLSGSYLQVTLICSQNFTLVIILDAQYDGSSYYESPGSCCIRIPTAGVFNYLLDGSIQSFTLYEISQSSYSVTDLSIAPFASSYINGYDVFSVPGFSSLSSYFFAKGQQDVRDTLADDLNSAYLIKDIVFAIFDAPFSALKKTLDFTIFGVNLSSFIISICSITFVFFVMRKIKGGS